jgi:hypothetical protein
MHRIWGGAKMAQTTERYDEPGLKEMLISLYRGMTVLFRQEMYFARGEMSNSLALLKRGTVLLLMGAVLGYSGFLVLLASAVIALAGLESVSLWLSALLVGFLVVFLGTMFLLSGMKKLKPENLKPYRTIEVVKEDLAWMKNQML